MTTALGTGFPSRVVPLLCGDGASKLRETHIGTYTARGSPSDLGTCVCNSHIAADAQSHRTPNYEPYKVQSYFGLPSTRRTTAGHASKQGPRWAQSNMELHVALGLCRLQEHAKSSTSIPELQDHSRICQKHRKSF